MHDTDRVVRQPVLSAVSDTGKRARRNSSRDFLDKTPTTAPAWAAAPVALIARGTWLPPIARPELEPADSILLTERVERVEITEVVAPLPPPGPSELAVVEPAPPPATAAGRTRRAVPTMELSAIGLPIRLLHPPRRWGAIVMCDLDGQPVADPRCQLARGTITAAAVPARRASMVPAAVTVATLALTAAVLLGLLLRPHASAVADEQPAAPTVIAPSVVPLREPAPAPRLPHVVPLRAGVPSLGFSR